MLDNKDMAAREMTLPDGYNPDEVVGKCPNCGGELTRGERDAAGICTNCYFAEEAT